MSLGAVEILSGPEPAGPQLGVYLGSFDPPHRGHEWIARVLLAQFGRVLLLLPATHFHKVIDPPRHATLAQRATMLEAIRARWPKRITIGLAQEVLFLVLDQQLRHRLGDVRLGFGMGDETFQHLLDSAGYFARTGRTWGAEEEQALATLCSEAVVFNRSGQCQSAMSVPDEVRALSSTLLRCTTARLRAEGASPERIVEQLAPWVPAGVAGVIAREGLYVGPRAG